MKSTLETMTESDDDCAIKKVKDKKLKFSEFDTMHISSIHVNLHEYCVVDSVPFYTAELLLWSTVNAKKNEFPIFIGTEVCGEDKLWVAYESIHVALKLVNAINGVVFVINSDGDITEDLLVEDIMEYFEDDSISELS